MLRIALPGRGRMEEPTLSFLAACGLGVERRNARQYIADIPALSNAVVLFQRAADITAKVEEGSADLGVTGLDSFHEARRDDSDAIIIYDDLGYSRCELVVAVPEAWIDVSSMSDLVELAEDFKAKGRELRVATTFPVQSQRFLLERGVNYFSVVHASGAVEAQPAMGSADIITDIVETGTSLRENRLKPLRDGVILKSSACLIGNRRALLDAPEKLRGAKAVLELAEARLRARRFHTITANMRGASAEAVAERVMSRPEASGMQGPTVSKVFSRFASDTDWYAVTVVVRMADLLTAVEHLREMGGSSVTVGTPGYVFENQSAAYQRLLGHLGLADARNGDPATAGSS